MARWLPNIASDAVPRVRIPVWAKLIGPLNRLYRTPILQRRVIRDNLDTMITRPVAAGAGVILSIIASYLLKGSNLPHLLELAIPILFVAILVLYRLAGTALVATSRNMRDLVETERQDVALTTLMDDGSFYYGVSIGNLLKGNKLFETGGCFVAGYLFMYLVIDIPVALMTSLFSPPTGTLYFGWMLIQILVACWALTLGVSILLLIAFSAALYATYLDTLTAVIMSAVHSLAVMLFGGFMLYIPFLIRSIDNMNDNDMLLGLASGGVFLLAWMILAVYLTSWTGLASFARARRPGYYADEGITSADFLTRVG